MKTILNKILNKIPLSILEDNPHSSARIQSYILLILILLMAIIFTGIELYNFIHNVFINNKLYHISNEIIIIYGMLLSHHLALIFSRRTSKTDDVE